jgi:hypothetical protein
MSKHKWSKGEIEAFNAMADILYKEQKAYAWRNSLGRLRCRIKQMTMTEEQRNAPIIWKMPVYISGVTRGE